MDELIVYRNGNPFWTIKPDASANQSKQIGGENVLNISFDLSVYVDFNINDYCTVFDELYVLNQQPILKKTASNFFAYTLKFQYIGNELQKALFLGLGPDNTLTESEFFLMGNAEFFVDRIIENINRISSGWEKGEIISTGPKNLGFKGEDCYTVLGRLSQEFNTEFWVIDKTIFLTKKLKDVPFTFQVGYNKGLWEITRIRLENSRIITRLYARGSEKNLPSDYAPASIKPRLHLPLRPSHGNNCLVSDITWFQSADDGAYLHIGYRKPLDPDVTSIELVWGEAGSGVFDNTITASVPTDDTGGFTLMAGLGFEFDAKFISHGGACEGAETDVILIKGNNPQAVFPLVPAIYLEKNVDKYGVIEGSAIFDEIYPHRTGTVTAVDAGNPFKFTDTDLDFNILLYRVPGLPVQITFITGNLGGYTFDVSSYDPGSKTFTILKNKNEQSIDVPSLTFHPEVDDEYVITNITLPDEYIEAAQDELLAKAKEVLDIYSQPQYSIQALLDTRVMKSYKREVFIGNRIWIKDTQLDINKKIRIVSCIRSLVEEYQFQLTLSDVVEVGLKDQILTGIDTSQRSVDTLDAQFSTRDVINGNMVLPPSSTAVGAVFENVLVDKNTNKLYRQE